MKTDAEKLTELIQGLEKVVSDMGWLHWPSNSSTRTTIQDRIRAIIRKAKS